ncbi:hypothetical protein DICVIV_08207 [Dictyocaulus viviparus]|uniref:Uncharacterized protein n=1 Tax=Dictyocaulus viviparus TaxID=29172 RepID=A0A0D8XPS7_DICVI|nr:hypothetical protein DICVIV_08207 [Dictyocaulus viviparus]
MKLRCNVEDCAVVVYWKRLKEEENGGQKEIFIKLKDPEGKKLSKIRVPWPDGEPQPSEITYLDSEECLRLTNNATFVTIPLRISKIRDLLLNTKRKYAPRRLTHFLDTSFHENDPDQDMLYNALKRFVEDPLADGTWSEAFECLSAKSANADGYLTKEEQEIIIYFILSQSFTSKELRKICEVLKRTNVFGPSCLGAFYELCLNLKQISLVRSVIHSSDALSERCFAVFLDFVASLEDSLLCRLLSVEKPDDNDVELLICLLKRDFDSRRLNDAVMQKVTVEHASTLLLKCIEIYVTTKCNEVAEQALSLISVLTDTFGNRMILEKDFNGVAKEALELFENMCDIISIFERIDLKRTQVVRITEEESYALYRIEKISLPRRPLNW